MSPRWFHNLPSANIRCSRNIQMTPLRKVEMALRVVCRSAEERHHCGVNERKRVLASDCSA
jgi:hypothetical protein